MIINIKNKNNTYINKQTNIMDINSPEISEIDTIDDALKFTIQNVDVSVINGIRRTILSNIETLVFKGTNDSITIFKNTTKFNNEYMKHRLMNIPIFNNSNLISDKMKNNSIINNYVVELNETNDTMEKKYVTTEHFKIKNKKTQEYLPQSEVEKCFPRDPQTGDFILFTILYPNFNKKNESNETLHFESNIDVGTSEENSCWNTVHNVCYENFANIDKISEKIAQLPEEEKRDFELLDAQRYYIKDKFKMTIQSLGVFSNVELIKMACNIIMAKLNKIEDYIINSSSISTKDELLYNETNGTLSEKELEYYKKQYCNLYKDDEFFVFELKDDDYTIGKLVEKYFNKLYGNKLDYIGFKKVHPTKKEAYIYMKYKSEINDEIIYTSFKELISILNRLFQKIESSF